MSSTSKPGLTWLELAIPFTLRAVFLFYLAPLFLALNIKGLAAYNIHLCSLLGCKPLQPKRLSHLFLKLVAFFLLPCIFLHCLFIFGGFSISTEKPMIFWEPSLISALSIFSTVILLTIPLDFFYKAERMMLVSGLKRVIFDGFQSSVSFSDVLLGDVLTSYSRVLGDFFNFTYQSFSLSLSQENSILASDIVTPLIISLPSFSDFVNV
ncbi:protein-ER retention protein [Entomophthora muscae]|uniref:Protein-ER retention protein n=1 Tax=Entomophthora muscae TaxID=34485 RepID=A0ACC2SG70_9FUNG|nr:protein-ER retention protein [Entomophthora muscae]